jgi:hypothetical protein
VGYAWPTVETIAGHIGCTKRRVWMLLAELEQNRLAARLGPNASRHAVGQQRWRLTLDDVPRLRDGDLPVDAPVENSPADPVSPHFPLKPVSGGACTGDQGGAEAGFRGGLIPASADLYLPGSESLSIEYKATPPPAPRLPSLQIGPVKKPAIPVPPIRKPKSAYEHVADVVRLLLGNPGRAERLFASVGATVVIGRWTRDRADAMKGDLLDASKVLCARRHILGWEDVITGAVESEWFKHFVLRAGYVRPRDEAKLRRASAGGAAFDVEGRRRRGGGG